MLHPHREAALAVHYVLSHIRNYINDIARLYSLAYINELFAVIKLFLIYPLCE